MSGDQCLNHVLVHNELHCTFLHVQAVSVIHIHVELEVVTTLHAECICVY